MSCTEIGCQAYSITVTVYQFGMCYLVYYIYNIYIIYIIKIFVTLKQKLLYCTFVRLDIYHSFVNS